jgi:hypothetical protein
MFFNRRVSVLLLVEDSSCFDPDRSSTRRESIGLALKRDNAICTSAHCDIPLQRMVSQSYATLAEHTRAPAHLPAPTTDCSIRPAVSLMPHTGLIARLSRAIREFLWFPQNIYTRSRQQFREMSSLNLICHRVKNGQLPCIHINTSCHSCSQ